METEMTAPAQAIPRVGLIVRGERCWFEAEARVVRSPWDQSPVAQVPWMSREQLRGALDWASERAAHCAAWPAADRMNAMLAWAELLGQNSERIARLESREVGKPIQQTRRIVGAVVARLKQLCHARQALNSGGADPESPPSTERAQVFRSREPLGLVAGILPFNSPVSALVWKIVPALLMGNAVVVKVSELAPVAALAAAGLLATLPLPQGALQVVNGLGGELGPVISEHPAVRMIGFTGGTASGTDIIRRSAATMKRLVLECGSNDAAIILADADLPAAAKMIADFGLRLYAGQLCTAPKRCLVDQAVYARFAEILVVEAKRLVIGDPLDDATDVGPLVNEAAAARVERQVGDSIAAGARLIIGGRRLAGALMPPTILGDVTASNPIFREGAFGPVVSLIATTDPKHAVELANDSPYALRANIYTADTARGADLARGLDCNGVAINAPPTVDAPGLGVAPRKLSGVGSEGVEASLMQYSQPKFIWTAE